MVNDVKIAGSGTISAGEYNIVSVAGSGKGFGDINCKLLKVAGSAKFEGNINSEEISVAGACSFLRDVKGNKVKSAGSVKVCGNISCEEFKAEGAITVLGECNIEVMDCKIEGGHFNNIYGESIHINNERDKKTIINEIEATSINVRNVEAKRISGDDVKITGRSVVDVIEFKNSLKIGELVTVKQIIKL